MIWERCIAYFCQVEADCSEIKRNGNENHSFGKNKDSFLFALGSWFGWLCILCRTGHYCNRRYCIFYIGLGSTAGKLGKKRMKENRIVYFTSGYAYFYFSLVEHTQN